MSIFKLELKQGRTALIIWTLAIASLIAVCVFMFPEMKEETDSIGELFASMGSFTAAFGMDRISIGTLNGFYCIEGGVILGLGGAFYASILGITALSKEESGKTAEWLLTSPVSRTEVVTAKLAAIIVQLTIMSACILGISLASIAAIGEEIPWKDILLMHLACYLLQIELACICFGISAFLRHNNMGIAIGIASIMYFLKLFINISSNAEFLQYLTPFSYCDGADIITEGCLNTGALVAGMVFAVIGVVVAYWRYSTKDIH